MSRPELEQFFVSLGDKKFRAQQLLQWIYQRGVTDFSAMTDLSKSLRCLLQEKAQIIVPQIESEQISKDGTIKWLLRVDAGQGESRNAIETVFIPETNRGTLCISSQVGCALDCTFCATARQGFNRNLSAAEIIGQVWLADQRLRALYEGQSMLTNVVYMGMGEPLMNYKQVLPTIELLLDDHAYGLGKRKVTVSTSGVVPKIDTLSATIDVSLAISLHAPSNEVRNELVPLNRKFPIEDLLAACRRYLDNKRRKESVTFEYVMLKDVNDSDADARALVKLLAGIPAKINLIPFNPWPGAPYQCSDDKRMQAFADIVNKAGYASPVRRPRGRDIMAACGQLKSASVKQSAAEKKKAELATRNLGR